MSSWVTYNRTLNMVILMCICLLYVVRLTDYVCMWRGGSVWCSFMHVFVCVYIIYIYVCRSVCEWLCQWMCVIILWVVGPMWNAWVLMYAFMVFVLFWIVMLMLMYAFTVLLLFWLSCWCMPLQYLFFFDFHVDVIVTNVQCSEFGIV